MEPFKLIVLSCCLCVLALNSNAQTETSAEWKKLLSKDENIKQKENKNSGLQADSKIFRVKHLHSKDHLFKQRNNRKPAVQVQQQTTELVTKKPMKTKKYKNIAKTSHSLNKKLLSKLGFTKVKAPNSHNRKRLAVESRRHASPDDSHMFIVKLPPNLYYYSNAKDTAADGRVGVGVNTKSASQQHEPNHMNAVKGDEPREINTIKENSNGKKVSFPFSSNGRPGRIYHWNLPVIQKMLEDKHRFGNIGEETKNQLIDIKDTPTWSKPWENESYDKQYDNNMDNNQHDDLAPISRAAFNSLSSSNMLMMNSYKKSIKRKSPTYYAPKTAVNNNSFNKYFSGNGKPKGFYVIKENQKKPLYYKNIIS